MSHFMQTKRCDPCQQFCKMWYSLNRVFTGTTLDEPTIFTHNGNLISYVKIKKDEQCKICCNVFTDCIYIKDNQYFTLFPHNELTIVNCVIKNPLWRNSSIIIPVDLGIFIFPAVKQYELLFLRGIKISPNMGGRMSTVYYSRDGIRTSSEINLRQCAFTVFYDIIEDVYLIDNNGNLLEYETLEFTGEKTKDITTNWNIYANNHMRVKEHNHRIEILTDDAPVGKRTKPALRDTDE